MDTENGSTTANGLPRYDRDKYPHGRELQLRDWTSGHATHRAQSPWLFLPGDGPATDCEPTIPEDVRRCLPILLLSTCPSPGGATSATRAGWAPILRR